MKLNGATIYLHIIEKMAVWDEMILHERCTSGLTIFKFNFVSNDGIWNFGCTSV